MATLILDTLDGAKFEQLGTVKQFVRTGIAYDLDTSNAFGTLYSVLQISNCPKWGDPDTVSRDTQLTRISVEPVGGGEMARCTFIYESFQGLAPSAYVITSRAYPRTLTTNRFIGTNAPLLCEYDPDGIGVPVAPAEADFFEPEHPKDMCLQNVFAPMRAVQVSQLIYGDPTPQQTFNGGGPLVAQGGGDKGDFICHVNEGAWRGKDTGYWMLSEYATTKSKFQGYYTTEATAITKVLEDWSETSILRHSQTGKYVNYPGMADDIARAMKRGYRRGYIYGNGPDEKKGFIRVGHYPTVSFSNLFGFK